MVKAWHVGRSQEHFLQETVPMSIRLAHCAEKGGFPSNREENSLRSEGESWASEVVLQGKGNMNFNSGTMKVNKNWKKLSQARSGQQTEEVNLTTKF